MSDKHTKLPWAVSEHLEIGPISKAMDQSNGFVIPVADVYGDNMHDDAYFIVHCVNNFDEAVTIMRDLWANPGDGATRKYAKRFLDKIDNQH